MEFYISPQSGQFYMINVLENQWLSVTYMFTCAHSITVNRMRSGQRSQWRAQSERHRFAVRSEVKTYAVEAENSSEYFVNIYYDFILIFNRII